MEPISFTNEFEVFQHYQVLRCADGTLWELGRGATGVTYKAFDTNLRSQVALKVILPPLLQDEASRALFLREARLAAGLRHPNIATIFHFGETADGACFYATEFCEGETIQRIVEEQGPFDLATALAIVLQVCRVLVLANEHQLVHRDIKPANLILTDLSQDELTVKVVGLGLAKNSQAETSAWAPTGTSEFVGTVYFASPEQLENKPLDGRSDIYSLGVTLWFLLTGQTMYNGSLTRIVSQHLYAPVPWQQLEGRDVPPVVRALLGGMLEKDPASRFPNAVKLKRAVEECFAATTGGKVVKRISIAPTIAAEASEPEYVDTRLAGRRQLVEERRVGPADQLPRAVDLRRQDASVPVKVLDARIATEPTFVTPERASSASRRPWLVVPLLLAIASAAAYLVLGHSSPPIKTGKVSPAAATSPARTVAVLPPQIAPPPAAAVARNVPVPPSPPPSLANAEPAPPPGASMSPPIVTTTALPPVATETPPLPEMASAPLEVAAVPPARSPRLADGWQRTLGEFVDGFMRCDQTHDVRTVLAYYGPVVDYFGDGRISQTHIRSDLLAFNQRWPVQRNRVVGTPDFQETRPGQSYSARFHTAFYVASTPRGAWVSGESVVEMNVEMIRGVPLIVSIREKMLHREKGTLAGR